MLFLALGIRTIERLSTSVSRAFLSCDRPSVSLGWSHYSSIMCDAVAQLQPTLSSRLRRAEERIETEYHSRRGDATTHPTEEEMLASGAVRRYLETDEGRRLYQIYLAETSLDESTNFASASASATSAPASANYASDYTTSAFDAANSASANSASANAITNAITHSNAIAHTNANEHTNAHTNANEHTNANDHTNAKKTMTPLQRRITLKRQQQQQQRFTEQQHQQRFTEQQQQQRDKQMQQLERSEQQHITANSNNTARPAATERQAVTEQQITEDQQHIQQRFQQYNISYQYQQAADNIHDQNQAQLCLLDQEIIQVQAQLLHELSFQNIIGDQSTEPNQDANIASIDNIANIAPNEPCAPPQNTKQARNTKHNQDTEQCRDQAIWIDRSLMGDPMQIA